MYRVFCLALLAGVLVSPSLGQVVRPEDTTQARARVPAEGVSGDYRLGPGDLVEISVFGVNELSQSVRINSAGNMTLPLVGKTSVAGLTATELEDRIKEALVEQQLVRDPQVTVFIKEYRSQPVYVLGAVNQPGQYMVTGPLKLLDALTLAGGLDTKRAGDRIVVQRGANRKAAGPSAFSLEQTANPDVLEVNIKALLETGDSSLNIPLEGGDMIQIPEKTPELFYVVGDVQRAGAFPLDQQQRPSVLSAISLAGGLGKTAKPDKARILREVPGTEKRLEIAVNITRILSGKGEDIRLKPEDVLVVPTSSSKSFATYMLPAAIASAVATLIWATAAQ